MEFKRLFFKVGHVLEVDGVKLAHQASEWYHVAAEHAEKLIAAGIAATEEGLAEEAQKAADALKADAEERKAPGPDHIEGDAGTPQTSAGNL